MSVEAITHQLPEPLIIPDDIERSLRQILSSDAHLQGIDLEIALQNPADTMMRLSTLLMQRFDTSTEYQMQVSATAKIFTIGTDFTDALQIRQNTGHYGVPTSIELSMATDGMNTMYPESTIAHITINDDMAWIHTIGFAGRHHGFAEYGAALVTEPHVINEIYLHALQRLTTAVETTHTLPNVSNYLKRELGKSVLVSQKIA
jgi:hypothetical protein